MSDLSVLDKIDLVVQQAVEQDDPMIAFSQLAELEKAGELVEAGKGKLIFSLSEVWDQFTISSHESLYTQSHVNLGWHPYTVDRYLTMWKYHKALPEAIQERPVREKFPITKALSQGHEITEDDWDDLERASSVSEIRSILRGIKEENPRKGSLTIYLERDGSVIIWYNNERLNAGFLDVHSDHEGIQKLVTRFVDNCGAMRK